MYPVERPCTRSVTRTNATATVAASSTSAPDTPVWPASRLRTTESTWTLVLETIENHGGRLRPGAGSGAFQALADLATFWHWPVDHRRGGGVALHAKMLVADNEVALLTSANFTDRESDNIEVGVLRDPETAGRLDQHSGR